MAIRARDGKLALLSVQKSYETDVGSEAKRRMRIRKRCQVSPILNLVHCAANTATTSPDMSPSSSQPCLSRFDDFVALVFESCVRFHEYDRHSAPCDQTEKLYELWSREVLTTSSHSMLLRCAGSPRPTLMEWRRRHNCIRQSPCHSGCFRRRWSRLGCSGGGASSG